ncbi:MAG: type II secretion system F family protein, partial [Dehalococcoidia bacterium]
HRLGGRNLGPVLESLSRAVRGTARAEQEVRALQARNVLSARIVAVLPLALIAAIRGLNPGYLDPFATPTGQVLLALCLLSVAGGYAAMLRAARLPMPRRRHV